MTSVACHAEALWTTTDFSAEYSFDISYDGSTPLYAQATTAGSVARAPLTPLQPERASVAVVGAPQQPSVGNTHGHRLALDWEAMPSLRFKSITSYRKLDQSQYDNGSGIASALSASGVFTGVGFGRYSLAHYKQDQFSTELQAIGDFPRVKFVGGALYYQESVEDSAQAFNTLSITNAAGTTYSVLSVDPATARIDRAARVKVDSVGVFGGDLHAPDRQRHAPPHGWCTLHT